MSVEGRYAPAEAVVVDGKITFAFSIGVVHRSETAGRAMEKNSTFVRTERDMADDLDNGVVG
jgi:hypothetical protein